MLGCDDAEKLLPASEKVAGDLDPFILPMLPVDTTDLTSSSLSTEPERCRLGVLLRLWRISLGTVYCVFQALMKHVALQKVHL